MRTARRKITNAEEALRFLDQLSGFDGDLPAFCLREGIDGRSLNCWRRNLARRGAAGDQCPSELRIVEVAWPLSQVSAPEGDGEADGQQMGRYRVSVADAVIEVDDAFREDTLARLLAVVRAC
ncbi:MAG: hypothetical protein GY772_07730 [bacterium]|nr:hypothetical protein [bacterium]